MPTDNTFRIAQTKAPLKVHRSKSSRSDIIGDGGDGGKIEIQRDAGGGDVEGKGSGEGCVGDLPGARDQQRDVLRVEVEVQRDGCVGTEVDPAARGGERAAEEDIRGPHRERVAFAAWLYREKICGR